MKDNYFHILKGPMYHGCQTLFGWPEPERGIGLLKKRIDALARRERTVVVRIGKDRQEYTIKAKKVKTYPIHVIHKVSGDYPLYMVKKSELNPRKPKTEEELAKENYLRSQGIS